MEWRKIKTLFIYVFAVLNIILLISYIYIDNKNKAERYEEQEAIIAAMRNDNIDIIEPNIGKVSLGHVSATIKKISAPSNLNNTYTYTYNYNKEDDFSIESLEINFEKPIANVNDDKYKEVLSNFISTELAKDLIYAFESYNSKEKIINYRQVIDGVIIYDNKNALIKFSVDSSGNIISLTQTGLTNFKKEKIENLASHSQAIYKLYHENLIPSGSKVFASLGYYTYVTQFENQVLIPTWRITVNIDNNEKIFYMDAINMKILDKNQ